MTVEIRTVAVFGANGLTGRLLVEELLGRGRCVRAITRDHGAMQAEIPGAEVVQADATNRIQVEEAIEGCDAVVSVLGTKYSKRPLSLYSASALAIVDAMHFRGLRRLVVTSAVAATTWRDPQMSWLEQLLITSVLERLGATLYEDMRRMEAIVAASDLDWTIMRPLGLASMNQPTDYAVARDHISGKQTARCDLASAIVDQLDHATDLQSVVAVATTNKTEPLPSIIWREAIRPHLRGRNK